MSRLAALAGTSFVAIAAFGSLAIDLAAGPAAGAAFDAGILRIQDIATAALGGRVRLADLTYHQSGMVIRVGSFSFGTDAASSSLMAAAQTGSASAENIVIETGLATYRIKRIDLAGTALSSADLVAVLDQKSTASIAERLAKLSAKTITIPEVVADMKVDQTTATIIYRNIKLEDVVNGKIATATAAGASFAASDAKIDDTQGSYGAMSAKGLDLTLATRIATETRKDPAEPKQKLYDTFELDGITLNSKKARIDASIGRISGNGAKGRPFTTSPAELRAMAGVTNDLSSTEQKQKAAKLLQNYLDSFEIGAVEAKDLTIHFIAKDKPLTLSLAHIAMSQSDADKIAEIGFDGFAINGDDAKIKLGSFAMRGLDLAALRKSLSDMGGSGDAGTAARSLTPALAQLVLTGLDADVADSKGEGNAAAGARDVFHITNVDITGSNQVDKIPTRFATKLDHFTMDLPQPTDGSLKQLVAMGYSKLDLSSRFAFVWNEPTKELTLTDIALDGVGMGAVKVSGLLGNVTKDVFSSDTTVMQAAALGMLLKSFDIRVDNAGLFEKTMAMQASSEGKSADEVRRTYVTAAGVGVPMMLGNGAAAKTIGAALAKFVASPKSFHVSATSAVGLGASDIQLLNDPSSLLDRLDVRATANE